jgi:hypothetical protein
VNGLERADRLRDAVRLAYMHGSQLGVNLLPEGSVVLTSEEAQAVRVAISSPLQLARSLSYQKEMLILLGWEE